MADRNGRHRLTRAVAFLDLAGFTALTEVHGDDYAADVHEQFLGYLDEAAHASASVECVKHLGDGALLVADSPDELIAGLRASVMASEADLKLRVRGGIHAGQVLQLQSEHGVDYLGHTVNVAARLASVAPASELLVTASALPSEDRGGFTSRGRLHLRHIGEPVEAWALPLASGALHIDPVCQMVVGNDALVTEHEGRTVWLCSELCRTRL